MKGYKTYISAAIGVLYIIGASLGWWPLSEEFLGAIGFASIAFLRAGVKTTALLVTGMTLTACKTTTGDMWLSPARVEVLSQLVVYSAASEDLSKNPDHMEAYKLADEKLSQLMKLSTWDTVSMLAIVKSLPFSELQTPEASIAFTESVLLVDLIGVGKFDAKRNDHIVAFLCGSAKGINLAINTSGRNLVLYQLRADELKTRR